MMSSKMSRIHRRILFKNPFCPENSRRAKNRNFYKMYWIRNIQSKPQRAEFKKECAVIVAHPDDESLWAGGVMLMNRRRRWKIVTVCRGGDPDRAPRFYRAAERYGAVGIMADLDDGPRQAPLNPFAVEQAIVSLVGGGEYGCVYTHSPFGEYTRHRRHEETGKAVLALWEQQALRIGQLWVFAYEDDGGGGLPRAVRNAHKELALPENVWRQKRAIITDTYGFAEDSFEARATPRAEAFWVFDTPECMRAWMNRKSRQA